MAKNCQIMREVDEDEDALVLHDEELGGLLQAPSVVKLGETEHVHHISMVRPLMAESSPLYCGFQ